MSIKKSDLAEKTSNREILEKLADDKYYSVRYSVAENRNTPVEILERLANDENKQVRREVAENPNTPVDILVGLADDESEYVRSGVAKNENTPVEILAKLADDESADILESLAQNPNTPVEALAKFVQEKYKNSEPAYYAAINPNISIDLLEDLANSRNYRFRCQVASNPNTPADILEKLANDENKYVRKYALEALKSRDISTKSKKTSKSSAKAFFEEKREPDLSDWYEQAEASLAEQLGDDFDWEDVTDDMVVEIMEDNGNAVFNNLRDCCQSILGTKKPTPNDIEMGLRSMDAAYGNGEVAIPLNEVGDENEQENVFLAFCKVYYPKAFKQYVEEGGEDVDISDLS